MWFGKITGDTVTAAAKREGFEAKEPVKGRQGVDDQEDTFLLQSIARHRDREAYARLFERYQRILLGLAYFMLRDRDAAEEVVQEAMLTVWTSASKFEGECGAGAWIKSIVFRKCLQTQRNRGRREHALRRLPAQAPAQERPQERPERAGSKQVLRTLLDGLSREDRVLVALYSAGELSQDQIAAALSLPQTTISYRLQKSMERLKAGLRAAGFASALPLVSQA